MNTDYEIHQKFSSLWSDADEPDTFSASRPLLSHYTSISTLECVMKNDEVWLGNPLLMNDVQELRFGIIEAAGAFRLHEGIREACGGTGSQRYHDRLT